MRYVGKAPNVPLELSPAGKEDPTMRISGRKMLKVKETVKYCTHSEMGTYLAL